MPAYVPKNPQQSWDLRLQSADDDLRVRLVPDKLDNPRFYRSTAPALGDVLNNQDLSYATVPPDQGEPVVVEGFSRGAGNLRYVAGSEKYRFGSGIATLRTGGLAYPGPKGTDTALTGGGDFDDRVRCWCLHETTFTVGGSPVNRSVPWVGTNGGNVYYWNPYTTLWVAPTTQPAGNSPIFDMVDFEGVIYVSFDLADPYEYTTDNGATWVISTLGQDSATYWAVADGDAAIGPELWMCVNPNLVFHAQDPTNTGTWDSGSIVGQATSADHFTSIRVAPEGGKLLLGKELGWHWLDSDGNTGIVYGPLPPDSGRGMENFAQPVHLGDSLFTVARDFGMVRQRFTTVGPTDYSPAAAGPGVEEMQRPIVALACDGLSTVYMGEGGSEGYVMQGAFGPDGDWQIHGAYVATGRSIGFMWMSSSANASDATDVENNLYLWVTCDAAPFLPKRYLMPASSPAVDAYAQFTPSATLYSGELRGRFIQETKVYSRLTPQTRGLSATATCALAYRLDTSALYHTLGTFTESPQPSSLLATYVSTSIAETVSGKLAEVRATLATVDPANDRPALESIVLNVFSRHLRKDALVCFVQAETAGDLRPGQRAGYSAQHLEDRLFAFRDSIAPVLVTRGWGKKRQWTVDLAKVDMQLDNTAQSGGEGTAQVFRIEMVELDTGMAPANFLRLLAGAVDESVYAWVAYDAPPVMRRMVVDASGFVDWSTDELTGLTASWSPTAIGAHPTDKDIVYAGISYRAGAINTAGSCAIFRKSGDAMVPCYITDPVTGLSATSMTGVSQLDPTDIKVSPLTGYVYATIGKREASGATLHGGADDNLRYGLYRSTDGVHFSRRYTWSWSGGDQNTEDGAQGIYLVTSGTRAGRIYVVHERATTISRCSYSDNDGATFTQLTADTNAFAYAQTMGVTSLGALGSDDSMLYWFLQNNGVEFNRFAGATPAAILRTQTLAVVNAHGSGLFGDPGKVLLPYTSASNSGLKTTNGFTTDFVGGSLGAWSAAAGALRYPMVSAHGSEPWLLATAIIAATGRLFMTPDSGATWVEVTDAEMTGVLACAFVQGTP